MIRNFRNIKAWQSADDLAVKIYSRSKLFPKEELYSMVSQIRRAAISIPTNIAEGASREHKREYLHFLYIARGSMAETEYLLHLSHRLKYLNQNEYQEIESIRGETAKMLSGLITSVKKEASFISDLLAMITSSIFISGFRFFEFSS